VFLHFAEIERPNTWGAQSQFSFAETSDFAREIEFAHYAGNAAANRRSSRARGSERSSLAQRLGRRDEQVAQLAEADSGHRRLERRGLVERRLERRRMGRQLRAVKTRRAST
jgi:hypothetical protein